MTANARNIQLTTNFNLFEFLRPEDPLPSAFVLNNLYRLANRLQVIRDILGKAIRINSGYRTPAHNQAVGGATQSQHLDGLAADIVVSDMSARQVQFFLQNWSGGMGCYESYTHLDIRPQKARW